MAMTFYVSHILISHLFYRWITERHYMATSLQVLLFAVAFILIGIVFAGVWLHHFKRGPLELALDTLTRFFFTTPGRILPGAPRNP